MKIPVIASLNGTSKGGWVRYAKMMQDAGADALELNIYFIAADLDMSGRDVEARYLDLVAAVKESVSIPLAVKVGPVLQRHGQHGPAAGRGRGRRPGAVQPLPPARHRPGDPGNRAQAGPEHAAELLVPLRWIAILRGRLKASLALTSGIHDADGLLKALLAGADVGMIASTLYEDGSDQVGQHPRRPAAVDGGEGVRLGRAAQGEHEPGELPRPGRLRARQLHEGPDVVHGQVHLSSRHESHAAGADRRRSSPRRCDWSTCRCREPGGRRGAASASIAAASAAPTCTSSKATCREQKMPVVPGHQVVGTVDALGPECRRLRARPARGRRLAAVDLRPLPLLRTGPREPLRVGPLHRLPRRRRLRRVRRRARGVRLRDPRRLRRRGGGARCSAPGIIGYRALKRSRLPPGGRLAMYGFGSSAHVLIQIARHRGCEVYVVTRDEKHRELARRMGAAWVGEPGGGHAGQGRTAPSSSPRRASWCRRPWRSWRREARWPWPAST